MDMDNTLELIHVVVAYDKTKWCGTPANCGGNGPSWQWGNELLAEMRINE